jgi:hypothetical protein
MRLIATICACAALSLSGLVFAGAAQAANVEVSLVGCYFQNGGQATVPAGSTVIARVGWAENNRGRVKSFLNAQTTTADVDGVPISNASGLWGPITKTPDFFVTFWRANVGTLAQPGDSVTVHFQVNLSHTVSEGKDPDTGEHVKAGPGPIFPADFSCTITAT